MKLLSFGYLLVPLYYGYYIVYPFAEVLTFILSLACHLPLTYDLIYSSRTLDMVRPCVAHTALNWRTSSASILNEVARFVAGFSVVSMLVLQDCLLLLPESILSIGVGIDDGCVPSWGTTNDFFLAIVFSISNTW